MRRRGRYYRICVTADSGGLAVGMHSAWRGDFFNATDNLKSGHCLFSSEVQGQLNFLNVSDGSRRAVKIVSRQSQRRFSLVRFFGIVVRCW